jgi:chemotaxis protein histidine kinase CheA
MLTVFVTIVLFIVRAIFKKGPSFKKLSILLTVSIAVFITTIILTPEPTPEQKARMEERKQEREIAAAEKSEAEEKEKEQKMKEKQERKEKEEQEGKEKAQKEKAEQEKQEKEQQETKEKENEEKPTESEVVTAKVNKEKTPKDEINLTNATDAKSIDKLLKKNHDKIEQVLLEDSIAIIVYSDGSFWSETSAFKDFAIESTSIMREVKDNNNLNGIGFVQMMSMVDQKGNESTERTIIAYFDKENYDEINFKNFVNQTYADSSNFYKVSNGYWMHPSIYQNVDEKALNGLPFVPSENSKGFETVSNITQ